jgi:hypothetical protein
VRLRELARRTEIAVDSIRAALGAAAVPTACSRRWSRRSATRIRARQHLEIRRAAAAEQTRIPDDLEPGSIRDFARRPSRRCAVPAAHDGAGVAASRA